LAGLTRVFAAPENSSLHTRAHVGDNECSVEPGQVAPDSGAASDAIAGANILRVKARISHPRVS
jgi:hypothetical protein